MVVESYAYKYGSAFCGDFGMMGWCIYDDLFGMVFDVSGLYGVVGCVGNIVSKVVRFVVLESCVAVNVSRRLSIVLEVECRVWVEVENVARVAFGKKFLLSIS